MSARRLGDDRGSVVAEFAVALPAFALVVLFGTGALASASRHVRLQDAASDAARLVARGEDASRAASVVSGSVGGADAAISRQGDLVCVTASAPAALPIAMLRLNATGCALDGGL